MIVYGTHLERHLSAERGRWSSPSPAVPSFLVPWMRVLLLLLGGSVCSGHSRGTTAIVESALLTRIHGAVVEPPGGVAAGAVGEPGDGAAGAGGAATAAAPVVLKGHAIQAICHLAAVVVVSGGLRKNKNQETHNLHLRRSFALKY